MPISFALLGATGLSEGQRVEQMHYLTKYWGHRKCEGERVISACQGRHPAHSVPGSQDEVTSPYCCFFLPRERANRTGPPDPDPLTYKVLSVVMPTQTSIFVYFILSDPCAPTQIMALFFLAPSVIFLSFPMGGGRHSLAWEHRHALPPGS